jgi:hypothetical protein
MSSYVSLYNETTGDFDEITVGDLSVENMTVNNAIVVNATITNATITNANINDEKVNTSTINDLTLTNKLTLPDGNVNFPSLTFTNETDLGMYRSNNGEISFCNNGQQILTIKTDYMWIPKQLTFYDTSLYITRENSNALSIYANNWKIIDIDEVKLYVHGDIDSNYINCTGLTSTGNINALLNTIDCGDLKVVNYIDATGIYATYYVAYDYMQSNLFGIVPNTGDSCFAFNMNYNNGFNSWILDGYAGCIVQNNNTGEIKIRNTTTSGLSGNVVSNLQDLLTLNTTLSSFNSKCFSKEFVSKSFLCDTNPTGDFTGFNFNVYNDGVNDKFYKNGFAGKFYQSNSAGAYFLKTSTTSGLANNGVTYENTIQITPTDLFLLRNIYNRPYFVETNALYCDDIQNTGSATINSVVCTSLTATTINATTSSSTTVNATTANITTLNSTTINNTGVITSTGSIIGGSSSTGAITTTSIGLIYSGVFSVNNAIGGYGYGFNRTFSGSNRYINSGWAATIWQEPSNGSINIESSSASGSPGAIPTMNTNLTIFPSGNTHIRGKVRLGNISPNTNSANSLDVYDRMSVGLYGLYSWNAYFDSDWKPIVNGPISSIVQDAANNIKLYQNTNLSTTANTPSGGTMNLNWQVDRFGTMSNLGAIRCGTNITSANTSSTNALDVYGTLGMSLANQNMYYGHNIYFGSGNWRTLRTGYSSAWKMNTSGGLEWYQSTNSTVQDQIISPLNQTMSLSNTGNLTVSGGITVNNQPMVVRACSTFQSIPSSLETTFTNWDQSIVNQGTAVTYNNNGVFSITQAGIYSVSFSLRWQTNQIGNRLAYITHPFANYGSTTTESPNNLKILMSGSAVIKCNMGDYIALTVFQSSNSPLNVETVGGDKVTFTILKLF